MKRWLAGSLLAAHFGLACADTEVVICYNYGCESQAKIVYSERKLAKVHEMLAPAKDAAEERAALAQVVGRLYTWAGGQSPVWRDKGGDQADGGEDGRMDCIDHALSTTRLLAMLEARGWLRFHRVLEPERRAPLFVNQHFSAAIEEKSTAGIVFVGERWVVDSWFRDNGQPAVIFPLENWMGGEGPDE